MRFMCSPALPSSPASPWPQTRLGLTKSRVSTVVQQLERQLGTRLLQRTTRHVRLTADGEQFLERSKELMADLEQLQAMFQPATSGLRGSLRIDMPNTLARDVVLPKLPEFLSAHPLLEVGISTSDRRVDVVQEGFDCVVRIGPLADTDLIARTLGALEMCNLASPPIWSATAHPQHWPICHATGSFTMQTSSDGMARAGSISVAGRPPCSPCAAHWWSTARMPTRQPVLPVWA